MNLVSKLKLYQYVPGFTIIIAVFLSVFTGIHSLSYIAIFYWSVYRSDLVPFSLLIGFGLICDSLSSHFLGEETFVYLVLTSLIHMDRRFLLHKDFKYLWQSIGSLILVIGVGKGLLAWQLHLSFSIFCQILDSVVGIIIFPIWVKLMAPLYSRVATL
jgi:rod shape-determining protein MreD